MKRKNKTAIVKVRPKTYPKQGKGYCGPYTIKAVLSAYNLDDKNNLKDYVGLLGKITGATFPRSMQKTLERYGFNAPIKRANKYSDKEKINSLKKEIQKNHIIIISIGNGYSSLGEYSEIRQQLIGHWISIWGYNEDQEIFYVYDSVADPSIHEDIPIGNITRTYDEILRDWKGAFYFRFRNYLYIPISKR